VSASRREDGVLNVRKNGRRVTLWAAKRACLVVFLLDTSCAVLHCNDERPSVRFPASRSLSLARASFCPGPVDKSKL